MNDFVDIKKYTVRIEADLDKNYLESHAVFAIVVSENPLGTAIKVPGVFGFKLQVKKSDEQKAKELLEHKTI